MITKQKKIVIIGAAVSLVFIVMVVLAYGKRTNCKNVNIHIEGVTEITFVDEADIHAIIKTVYPDITGIDIRDVDTRRLEQLIDSFPPVKKADVYSRVNGELAIDIVQRVPLLRVFNSNNASYYLDAEGQMMPVSKNKPARCLVANGNIPEQYTGRRLSVTEDSTVVLEDVYNIAKAIIADEFLNAQIAQIYVTKDNKIELVPLIGYHIVNLGDAKTAQSKLRYLKHFYTQVLNQSDWNQYKYIDLEFNNQIVCTINPY